MQYDLALSSLDANEIRATLENIEDAKKISDGPPARMLPEGLCREIEIVLSLVERYAKIAATIHANDEPN